MAINISDLRSAAKRTRTVIAKSLREAANKGIKTAFLCHSHHDAALAKGLEQLLSESGWRVYIDWDDTEMPATPNRETARRLQSKIVSTDFFLFLATENSMSSRWCPWEIGYADGKKNIDDIIIIPTTDGYRTHGNEYLELYRRMDLGSDNLGRSALAVWQPNQSTNGIWASDL